MARTAQNETVNIPAATLEPVADAVRNADTAKRADRRAILRVGEALHEAMTDTAYTARDFARALKADGFARSEGWYSQTLGAYRAIHHAGLDVVQAAHDRGTEDKPGGIGSVYAFYRAASKVNDRDTPDFVHAWIRGVNPAKPTESPDDLVNVQVTRETRDRLKAFASERGFDDVASMLARDYGVSVAAAA